MMHKNNKKESRFEVMKRNSRWGCMVEVVCVWGGVSLLFLFSPPSLFPSPCLVHSPFILKRSPNSSPCR